MTERPTESLLKKYLAARGDAVQNGSAAPTEPDAAENMGCFGWHRGIRDLPRMLELRKKDGSIVAISYGLIERVEFDPDEGITIHATGKKVRITGTNLNGEVREGVRLFQGIVRHRVPWVVERAPQSAIGDEPTETGVDSIVL